MVSITTDGSEAARIMRDGLVEGIRASLRTRILERIKPDIEAAIDDAIKALETGITTYHDHFGLKSVVNVILEDRRLK